MSDSSCSPARGYKFISDGSSVVLRVRFTENSLGGSCRWIYFASLVLFSGQKCEALQCVYLAEKDRCIFSDSHAVSLRRDLRGILLLDTALQTPVSRAEDVIKLEIPLAEVGNWPGEWGGQGWPLEGTVALDWDSSVPLTHMFVPYILELKRIH